MPVRKPAAPPTGTQKTPAPHAIDPVTEQAFLSAAQRHCEARGARLTPLRSEVLLYMFRNPGGIKAYDLLAGMQASKPGIAPMSIYRTLDFLVDTELAHKVDATSSFILCEHGHHSQHDHGHPILMICEQCGQISECSDHQAMAMLEAALGHIRQQAGFHAHSMEIKGIGPCCGNRQENTPSTPPAGNAPI